MRGINDIRITFEEKINKYAVKQIQPHMINALAVMLCDEAVNETLFSLGTIENMEVIALINKPLFSCQII